MKKFLVFICLLALISFAGAAFGEGGHGGHVDAAAEVNTNPAADYNPTSEDITVEGGTVEFIAGNTATPTQFKATSIYLPNLTANKVAVMSNIKINVTVTPGAKELKISFARYNDKNTTDLYAFIEAHTTSGAYVKGMFYAFLCTVDDKKVLSFTVKDPELFFSENTVVLATVKTVPTDSGSSSGGCNAGYAGLLLFAAVPFLFRKKK